MNPDKPIKITKDQGFVAMPNWVHDRIRKNQFAQATYNELARYADKERECWPSRQTLADSQGVSLSTVKKALKLLKDLGCVMVTESGKKLGESNLYHLPWVPVGGSPQIPQAVEGGSPQTHPRVPPDPPRRVPPDPLTITNGTIPMNHNHKDLVTVNGHQLEAGKRFTPIDEFFVRYESRLGQRPVIHGGRDGKLLGEIDRQLGREEFRRRLDLFFGSLDEFVIKAGFTVGVFVSQVNKVGVSLGREVTKDDRNKIEAQKWLNGSHD